MNKLVILSILIISAQTSVLAKNKVEKTVKADFNCGISRISERKVTKIEKKLGMDLDNDGLMTVYCSVDSRKDVKTDDEGRVVTDIDGKPIYTYRTVSHYTSETCQKIHVKTTNKETEVSTCKIVYKRFSNKENFQDLLSCQKQAILVDKTIDHARNDDEQSEILEIIEINGSGHEEAVDC